MDISEVKRRRDALAEAIRLEVQSFERETGLSIDQIVMERLTYHGVAGQYQTKIASVRVEVSL